MAYANKRPESPKGQVYSCFIEQGAAKASAMGQEKFGVSVTKLQRWFDEWSSDAPKGTDTKAVERANNTEANSHGKRRVYDVAFPGFFGTVVNEGPQVSEVRWDNNHPAPNDKYVQNKFLVDAPTLSMKKSKRELE